MQERCPACDAAATIAISAGLSVSGTANTGTFDGGKNVGTGKSVTATLSGLSLGSTDAGNYRISTVTTPLTADITKPNLTISNGSCARAN